MDKVGPLLKTRLTELLGIKHPIIQSGANYVGVPELVAAVSNAGGLGILASGRPTTEEIRQDIKAIRELTDKPFGVNLVAGGPGYEEHARVMIEERVPVINHARGNPDWLIQATKGMGIRIIPTVGAPKHAIRAEQSGADALIVQGREGGGHTSYIGTMVLLPLLVDSVKIPVIAAGGFSDGRGLVAALALGAEGICMGTRFAATKESGIPQSIKELILRSTEADTFVTTRLSGYPLRLIRNKLTTELERQGKGFSWWEKISGVRTAKRMLGISWWKFIIGGWKMRKEDETSFADLASEATAIQRTVRGLGYGDAELGAIPGGQICGRINDIPTAGELIERIMAEARATLEALKGCREQ